MKMVIRSPGHNWKSVLWTWAQLELVHDRATTRLGHIAMSPASSLKSASEKSRKSKTNIRNFIPGLLLICDCNDYWRAPDSLGRATDAAAAPIPSRSGSNRLASPVGMVVESTSNNAGSLDETIEDTLENFPGDFEFPDNIPDAWTT
ncbi:unnamed protein product, partial [Rhizoctonia solani]